MSRFSPRLPVVLTMLIGSALALIAGRLVVAVLGALVPRLELSSGDRFALTVALAAVFGWVVVVPVQAWLKRVRR